MTRRWMVVVLLLGGFLVHAGCGSSVASHVSAPAPSTVSDSVVESAEPPVPQRGCGWVGAGTPTATTPPVVDAVIAGDIERLSGLLNRGADPNTVDASLSSTPLSIAAVSTCAAAVRLLLAAGADPNLIAKGGEAPLTFAANVGDIDIVTLLLAAGADPSKVGGYGMLTPLHEAVGVGRASVVRLMLPHVTDIDAGILPGANPLAGEDVGVGSALEFAAATVEDREGYLRLQLLLEAGATPTLTALYRAVLLGSATSILLLLVAGAPITLSPNETRTLAQVAVGLGHLEFARILQSQ